MINSHDLNKEEYLIISALTTKPGDITKAFLAASGITSEDDIIEYHDKIERLHAGFEQFASSRKNEDADLSINVAKNLCDFFGQRRSIWSDNIFYHKAIDNCLNHDVQGIGNCWNLAALFYDLGTRSGARLGMLYLLDIENAQQHGLLQTLGPRKVILDPQEGFDVEPYPDAEEFTLTDFVAMMYLNRTDFEKTPEEKARLCGMAIKLSPHRAEGYSELATVHIQYKGNINLAIQLCRQAAALGQNHPIYRVNLASAYHEAGRSDLAMDELRKIKDERPDFVQADELMRKILAH